MTAPRSARSAWLLVGCTSGWAAKVHSAGQILSRVAREAPALAVAGVLGGVPADDRLQFALQGADAALQLAAVAGVLVDLPCAGPGSPDTWLLNATIMPWRADGAPRPLGPGCGSRGVRAASAR